MTVEELKVIISAETRGFNKTSKNIKKTLTSMNKTINGLQKKLQNAFNIRENNNRGLDKISSSLEGLQKAANGVSGAVGAIGENIGKRTSIRRLATDFGSLKEQIKDLIPDIYDIINEISILTKKKVDGKITTSEYDKSINDLQKKYKEAFRLMNALGDKGVLDFKNTNTGTTPVINQDAMKKYIENYTPQKDLSDSNSYLEKQKNTLSTLKEQLESFKSAQKQIAPEYKKMESELAKLQKEIDAVAAKWKSMTENARSFAKDNNIPMSKKFLEDMVPRLSEVNSTMDSLKEKFYSLTKDKNYLGSNLKMAQDGISRTNDEIAKTKENISYVKDRIKETNQYLKQLNAQSKKTTKSVSKLSRVLRMIKMSAGFMILSKIFSAITKSVSECFTALMKFDKVRNNILGYNTAMSNLNSSFKKLGGEISIVAAQILQALEPVLTRIISLVNTVIIQLSRLFAIFTGKKQVAIVKDNYWKDYTEDVKGATAAQKKFVASFDELNIITKNNSGGGSSSSDSNLSEELFDIEDIKLTDFEQRLKDIFDKWKKTMPKLEITFDKKKALSDLKDIIANIANVIGGVGSLVISIGIKIANDLNLGQLLNDILGLVNDFTYLTSCITDALVPAFQTFYDYGISPIVKVLGETLHDIIQTVGGWFRSWGDLFIELTPVFDAIAKTLGTIVGFIGETVALIAQAAWKVFKFVLEGIGNILKSIAESTVGQAILTGLGTALGLILLVNGAVTAFTGVMKIASGVIGAVKGAMTLFNAVLAANPITLVIAAIAGLVAAFVYLWNNCESFRNFWIKCWEAIKKAALNVANWFKNDVPTFFQNCFDKVHTALNNLKNWFSNTFDSIKQKVNNVVDNIKNAISGAIQKVKQLFGYSDSSVTISTKTNGRKPATQSTSKAIATPFAKGGVIKTPTLGLVGEYAGAKSNPEIISPQSVITEIINEKNDEMISVMTQLFRQTISAIENQDMSVSIGDETIARSAARGNKANINRTGKSLF